MTAYVALLRGVNLGKRRLKMEDLRQLSCGLGLEDVQTYIASGNLLFRSGKSEKTLKAELEAALATHMGVRVGVMVRTVAELSDVIRTNPFKNETPSFTVAIFLDEPPAKDAPDGAKNLDGERLALGRREIYVHYPRGQGQSRLAIPAAAEGTARNMNTVAKLAELAREKA
jgi:uncharacterized protein (DUF1697 family)